MLDPDDARDAQVCDGWGLPPRLEALYRERDDNGPTYLVWRDLEGRGDLEQVERSWRELSDQEVLALPPVDRSRVLALLGCVVQQGRRGTEIVLDPLL